ncbi:MAG: ABC transporter substrate-binding protein [Proteobacteria bacterium]|nr:ABC transporter substrate-binding protein [Pseudomonadota bacterium]
MTRAHFGLAALALLVFAEPAAAQGVLRIAVGTSLSTLDPARTTTGEEYIYDNLVFSGLTRMRADLSVEPELAERWDFTPDLKSWTFHLRRGVKFHSGREMVAQDVIKSFERILDPATGAAPRTNYEMIERMTAVDPHTVRFDLKYAYGGFADIMSDRQVKIVPHDGIDALPTQPVGTGPFVFKSYTPGDRLVLARNPAYWEAGAPKLDGVELRVVPEIAVRLAALQAGDLDIIWEVPPEQAKALGGKPGVRVDSVATASWDAAIMNSAIAPFNDPKVRQAFHLAVDKRDVVELTLSGEGAPTHSPIPPNHPFFNKDLPIGKADPRAARQMLAAAGHPNGVKVPLVVPAGRAIREKLGVTLQQLAKPGGFDIEIQRVPFARYNAEISGKAPFYVDGYFARPTVDTSTYPFLHSSGSWNARLFHYKNAQVDEVLDKARLTGKADEQKPLYLALQKHLVDDPPGYIAYAINFVCAYRTTVQGVATHPMRWFDLRAASIAP